MRYIVAKKCSVLLPSRKRAVEGQEVPSDVPMLADWIASGFVEPVGASGQVEAAAPAGGAGESAPVSLWNLDASSLKRKSLEQLNCMIRERDPSALLASSRADAIAKLTSKA